MSANLGAVERCYSEMDSHDVEALLEVLQPKVEIIKMTRDRQRRSPATTPGHTGSTASRQDA
jgi:hypothetical protein